MADTAGFGFSFLVFLLLTFSFTLVLSRTILPISSKSKPTKVLDVSASIEESLNLNALKIIPHRNTLFQQSLTSTTSSSSLISLQLHSRISVHGGSHKDYKSLTLSRLGRDSARVRSLQTRLDLAVYGFTNSDLKPMETGTYFTAEDLEVPVISGTSQGSGEYFSRVGIGHPASQVYMVLDTGSDVNWVQWRRLLQQADPIFEPASSSSYSPLTCETQKCKSLDAPNAGTTRVYRRFRTATDRTRSGISLRKRLRSAARPWLTT